MNRIRIYNDSEIRKLMQNNNVYEIKNKSQIIYKREFKFWAIKQKLNYPEKTARQIFEEAGFDMNILDDRTPQKRLYSWMKKYNQFGEDYFKDENKYSYKAKEKENKVSDIEKRFIQYVKKAVNNPNFVAFIIDKDETGKIRINNLVSVEDEKTNS